MESGRMKPRVEAQMEGWWGPEPRVLDSVDTEEPSRVLLSSISVAVGLQVQFDSGAKLSKHRHLFLLFHLS